MRGLPPSQKLTVAPLWSWMLNAVAVLRAKRVHYLTSSAQSSPIAVILSAS